MNRRFNQRLGGRVLALVFCALLAATGLGRQRTAGGADWPLIRGDAQATGAVADPLQPPLDVLWTYRAEKSGFEATA